MSLVVSGGGVAVQVLPPEGDVGVTLMEVLSQDGVLDLLDLLILGTPVLLLLLLLEVVTPGVVVVGLRLLVPAHVHTHPLLEVRQGVHHVRQGEGREEEGHDEGHQQQKPTDEPLDDVVYHDILLDT